MRRSSHSTWPSSSRAACPGVGDEALRPERHEGRRDRDPHLIGGASVPEMSRSEWYREGRVPLHTLRANRLRLRRGQDDLRRHRLQGVDHTGDQLGSARSWRRSAPWTAPGRWPRPERGRPSAPQGCPGANVAKNVTGIGKPQITEEQRAVAAAAAAAAPRRGPAPTAPPDGRPVAAAPTHRDGPAASRRASRQATTESAPGVRPDGRGEGRRGRQRAPGADATPEPRTPPCSRRSSRPTTPSPSRPRRAGRPSGDVVEADPAADLVADDNPPQQPTGPRPRSPRLRTPVPRRSPRRPTRPTPMMTREKLMLSPKRVATVQHSPRPEGPVDGAHRGLRRRLRPERPRPAGSPHARSRHAYAMTRAMKRGGKVRITIFPDRSITRKPLRPAWVRKGSPDHWVAAVKPSRMLFEISGVSEELAREAMCRASHNSRQDQVRLTRGGRRMMTASNSASPRRRASPEARRGQGTFNLRSRSSPDSSTTRAASATSSARSPGSSRSSASATSPSSGHRQVRTMSDTTTTTATERGARKTRQGIVVSDKQDKTIVVQVARRTTHPLYGKTMNRSKTTTSTTRPTTPASATQSRSSRPGRSAAQALAPRVHRRARRVGGRSPVRRPPP